MARKTTKKPRFGRVSQPRFGRVSLKAALFVMLFCFRVYNFSAFYLRALRLVAKHCACKLLRQTQPLVNELFENGP